MDGVGKVEFVSHDAIFSAVAVWACSPSAHSRPVGLRETASNMASWDTRGVRRDRLYFMDTLEVPAFDQSLTKTSNILSRQENGSWHLTLDDGTVIPLDERRGKEFYVILKLTERLKDSRQDFSVSEDFPTTMDEYILTRVDCFKLVARALVDHPVKTSLDGNVTSYFQMCTEEKFHEYESFADLETELFASLKVGQFLVGQIIGNEEGSFVLHSMLLVRGETGLYILHKSGNQGPVILSRFEKGLFLVMKHVYGKRMAFVDFDDMADNPQLKTYFENPLPRAR